MTTVEADLIERRDDQNLVGRNDPQPAAKDKGEKHPDECTLVQAVTKALAYALAEDPRVHVFGQDVGLNGGVFRATADLRERFGKERVFDTVLAELSIAGFAIGAAASGLVPVAEIQFSGFAQICNDLLISHASRLRTRTLGRLSVPMVLRAPFGGGIGAPEHHGESNEGLFAAVPGMRTVIPSTPARAYGLLLAAIRDPDPVVFLEPARVYRTSGEIVQDSGKALPLDTCFLDREGSDITLLSWGATLLEVHKAADRLEEMGHSVEIIDVATVAPLDEEGILSSVRKTQRVLVVQEAPIAGSVGANIMAMLMQHALGDIFGCDIVAGYSVPMPAFGVEHAFMPSVQRIVDHAVKVLE